MIEIDVGFQKKIGGQKTFKYFMNLQGEVYRDIDDRKTSRFFVDGDGFFIKQHFGIGWKEIFKNLLQLKLPITGAKNEYEAIKKLKALHIDTMDIVGFSQQGFNPASLQSFLITRELDNTISLEDYCANWSEHPPVYREKKLLIQTVAEIVKKMHGNGINHRDLYICHFLMNKTDNLSAPLGQDGCHLFLIDLHRTQIRKNVPERWLVKDLAGLCFSSMDIGLTKRDLLHFIKIYRGAPLRKIFERERSFWQKIEYKANVLYGKPESKKKR